MKTIGLIGGTMWVSTADYYAYINREVQRRLGNNHSARIVLISLDYREFASIQERLGWPGATAFLSNIARSVEASGADCLLLCANTLHRVAPEVQRAVKIPIISIIDATGKAIQEMGLSTVALLGTRITMEEDFYKSRLYTKFDIETVIPNREDRKFIQDSIENIDRSIRTASVKGRFIKIIRALQKKGAQGVILGCTEIPLIVKQRDVKLPAFDTTRLHAMAAVDFAVGAGKTVRAKK